MQERMASLNGVIAGATWLATGGLLAVAAGLMMAGYWKASLLVAEAACCTSAYAAVRHIRCYASAVCRKIEDRDELAGDIRRLSSLPPQRVR